MWFGCIICIGKQGVTKSRQARKSENEQENEQAGEGATSSPRDM